MTKPLRILLLCDDHPDHADTLHAHIGGMEQHSRHQIVRLNPVGIESHPLLDDLEFFDVILLHWSLVITFDTYLAPSVRARIHRASALKVQFIQDEYRWVDDITRMMRYLGVEIIYSVAPPDEFDTIYGSRAPDARVLPTLTGYVPDALVGLPAPAASDRPLDIVYRGRELPPWMGRLAREKLEIGRNVERLATARGLQVDIATAEEARVYGGAWLDFLRSGRATLATPSGSSITDFDGTVQRAVEAHLADRPDSSFEELADRVLAPYEGNVLIDVVSQRIFEAAATRTALIVFEGRYSEVLDLRRHAFVLERDYSNFDEIADALRDPSVVEGFTTAAYDDLIASGRWAFARFVTSFDDEIDCAARRRRAAPWDGPAPDGSARRPSFALVRSAVGGLTRLTGYRARHRRT